MGTTVEKADYAFETKDLLKTEINKINNVLTDESTFRSYPQELFNGYLDILNNGTDTLWNNLEKVSQTGTEPVLENVETAPIKMVLNGNTIQDGTPTPDTPVEVKVVKGENVVSVQGKNLLDTSEDNTTLNALFNGTNGNVINDVTKTNCIFNEYIKVELNTSYTISSNEITNSSIYTYVEYDKNKNFLNYFSTGDKPKKNLTFVTSSNTAYIRIRYKWSTEVEITNKIIENNKIQLEQGSTATPYVPYSKTDYPINLGDIELCKIGDYQDYLYKNNGKWYKYKAIEKVALGSLKWGERATNTENIYRMRTGGLIDKIITPSGNQTPLEAFCSHFEGMPAGVIGTYGGHEGISCASSGEVHIYTENYNTSTSANDFKTWLTNNGVILYYQLLTPTEEEITNTTLIEQLEAISKAKSVKDKTYITQTNDELPFILDVEAIKEYEVN